MHTEKKRITTFLEKNIVEQSIWYCLKVVHETSGSYNYHLASKFEKKKCINAFEGSPQLRNKFTDKHAQ